MKSILLLDDKETIAKLISVYLSSEFEIIYFDNAVKGYTMANGRECPRFDYIRYQDA